MPTLQEISERATAAAERTVRMSRAMDLAWLEDQIAVKRGLPADNLDKLIDRQFQDLLGEFDVDSGIDGGSPGTNPEA